MAHVLSRFWLTLLGVLLLSACKKEKDEEPMAADAYTVSTFAGQPYATGILYADGPGTEARFFRPSGVATDAQGNVYVSEEGRRIRKITPSGLVSTVAGTGMPGFSDGPAATATFTSPRWVAVDAPGNVYVVTANRLRKITPAGTVTTLAGQLGPGLQDGNLSTAQFGLMRGVAVDAQGNLYVADGDNHRIRKITPAGLVSTLATLDSGETGNPLGIGVDGQGNVYISEQTTFFPRPRIHQITPTGQTSIIAGGEAGYQDGSGTQARFSGVQGIAIDAQGTLFVTDEANHTIRQISRN